MRRFRSASLPVLLLLACSSRLPASGLDECFGHEEDGARRECFRTHLGDAAQLSSALEDLGRLSDSEPVRLLQVLDAVATPDTLAPELAAEILDLRGRALMATDQFATASRAFDEALAFDDGTTRVRWVGADGRVRREAIVDIGSGRLVRAARAAAAAGRMGRASELATRALTLGAGAEPLAADPQELVRLGASVPDTKPLLAEPWYRPLPDLPIPLFDGEPFSIADASGSVVLLDFWATWCGPCVDELPLLQALWEAEKDRGLLAVAINTQEPREIALPFARALGLRLPLASYTPELDRIYRVRQVPTLILVDRRGRIRERWDGYFAGLEEEVARKTRALLDARPAESATEIARVLLGVGRLEVAWMRDLEARVEGVTTVDVPAGGDGIVASVGSRLVLYGPGGMTVRRWDWPRKTGRLSRGERGADGSYRLTSFRLGAPAVHQRRMPDGEPETLEVGAPVLDVVVTDALAGPGRGAVLAATVGGLQHRTESGWEPLEGFGETLSLASAGHGETARLLVLGSTANGTPRVAWLDRDLRVVAETKLNPGVSGLVVDADRPEEVGLTPLAVKATATGRFWGSRRLAALATAGQLVLVDPGSGEVAFRALWEGITGLAAGDLDGDGRDELIVAQGRRLTVLEPTE